jgi:hypothetical protein
LPLADWRIFSLSADQQASVAGGTMRNIKNLIVTISAFVLFAASSTISATEASEKKQRPEWCRPHFECVETSEIVVDSEYHIELREQVLRYKRRAQRFGLTVGFGLGVGGVVNENYDVHWVPAGGPMIVWGLRF